MKNHPEDQVFQHFLWRTSDTEQPRVYQWLRLNFGENPAPDIAVAAINTLAKASEGQFPEAANKLCTHVYADDIGVSRESERNVSRSQVKSMPFSRLDNSKSRYGIQIIRTLTRQMKNSQISLDISGIKFTTSLPSRKTQSYQMEAF